MFGLRLRLRLALPITLTRVFREKTDARKDGRHAENGQNSNDLVPGFERMDQAGHCWCITTGDRSGKMAKNHQSHSSADSAT